MENYISYSNSQKGLIAELKLNNDIDDCLMHSELLFSEIEEQIDEIEEYIPNSDLTDALEESMLKVEHIINLINSTNPNRKTLNQFNRTMISIEKLFF